MGSSGTGSFSDYSSSSGGKQPEGDICTRHFQADLEEVATCDYWRATKGVPQKGAVIRVVVKGRPAAITDDGVLVGYLPTKHNYIVSCIRDGFTYQGVVSQSSHRPVPQVYIDITNIEKP